MDRSQARDLINTFVTERFVEVTTDVTGQPGELRYQGVRPVEGQPLVPANNVYWARVALLVAAEPQETLRCEVRRFVTMGSAIIQLFCPTVDVNAQLNLDIIAERMRNYFRTHNSAEIEFTNARISDNIPAESNWLRANIVSDFAYRQFI
jgi:hypothetical protein